MTGFKVCFPTGYQVSDIGDDNLDVNIVLPDNLVYFGTLYTLLNIQKLMKGEHEFYFWSTNMLVVKDLKRETIFEAISKIVEDAYLKLIFSNIGSVDELFPDCKSFDEVICSCSSSVITLYPGEKPDVPPKN